MDTLDESEYNAVLYNTALLLHSHALEQMAQTNTVAGRVISNLMKARHVLEAAVRGANWYPVPSDTETR